MAHEKEIGSIGRESAALGKRDRGGIHHHQTEQQQQGARPEQGLIQLATALHATEPLRRRRLGTQTAPEPFKNPLSAHDATPGKARTAAMNTSARWA